jgi:hypothetical protein
LSETKYGDPLSRGPKVREILGATALGVVTLPLEIVILNEVGSRGKKPVGEEDISSPTGWFELN